MTMTERTMERTGRELEPRTKQELTGAETTRPGRTYSPTVDIFETDDAITVLADMPGVRADGLSIDLHEDILTIDGRVANDVEGNDERVLMREYATGGYRREFRVTNLIDRDRIDASLRDGVLKLVLPKAEAARPRRIEVRAR
jgi:HSP20 family molecular chaperone IbpA